jgi:DNA-directed RNA polymerase specialized sigma24 family protein
LSWEGDTTEPTTESFESFAKTAAPRLQRAFVAAYGSERGNEAAAEALGYAWEHWKRVATMENPMGYLFRVGQSRTRPRKRPALGRMWDRADAGPGDVLVEPGLQGAMAELSEPQRIAVVLVHGYAWTLREVAELVDVSVSTVQTHVERALAKLRSALEVVDDE